MILFICLFLSCWHSYLKLVLLQPYPLHFLAKHFTIEPNFSLLCESGWSWWVNHRFLRSPISVKCITVEPKSTFFCEGGSITSSRSPISIECFCSNSPNEPVGAHIVMNYRTMQSSHCTIHLRYSTMFYMQFAYYVSVVQWIERYVSRPQVSKISTSRFRIPLGTENVPKSNSIRVCLSWRLMRFVEYRCFLLFNHTPVFPPWYRTDLDLYSHYRVKQISKTK